MGTSEPKSPPVSTPVHSDGPPVCQVVVDTTDSRINRRRWIGVLTLIVAAAWGERADRAFRDMGQLTLARSMDAFIGSSVPDGRSTPSTRKQASQAAAETASRVLAWGEGVRYVWVTMMWTIAGLMVIAGLWSLITGSPRTVPLYGFIGWLVIASTMGTFLGISLLVAKAGFPLHSPRDYMLLTLLHSGYGWFLLFVCPVLMPITIKPRA